jgi:uncharacterized protein
VISSPWNLDISDAVLRSTWIGREVYSKTLGTAMKKLFQRYERELASIFLEGS